MFDRFVRVVGAFVLVAAGFGVLIGRPAYAAVGDSPKEGEWLEITHFTKEGELDPGQSRWFRIYYPGGGRQLGITLRIAPADDRMLNLVNGAVDIGNRADALGDPDADWNGFSRLGLLGRTDNSGPDGKFWFNSTGEAETYYVRLWNNSADIVNFRIVVDAVSDPVP